MKNNSNLAMKILQNDKKGWADRYAENGHVFPLTLSLTAANNGLESSFELLMVSFIKSSKPLQTINN